MSTSTRSHLSSVAFFVVILLGFTSQVVLVKSAVPPFSDPTNDLFDENGKSVTAEPYLDITTVDYGKSGSDYIFELTLNAPVPSNVDPSLWIDWGIMINSDKNGYTGWRGYSYNDLGADLFIRLGMGKSGTVRQVCELTPSFKVIDQPDCKVEGTKITFTVHSSIGNVIDSGCPWMAVARKWDESGQKERFLAGDKAPNEGYYITPAATTQTTATGILTETTRAETTFTQKTISAHPPVNWTIIDNVNNIDWNSASRIVAGGLTWESISTKYFTLCYNTSREQPIPDTVARVDNVYTFLKAYSGVDAGAGIRIWLSPSTEVHRRITQEIDGQPSSATAYGSNKRQIFIDLTGRDKWTGVTIARGAYLGIILHEVAHYFISQRSPGLSYLSWGNEIMCHYFHWKAYALYGSRRYLQPLLTTRTLQVDASFANLINENLIDKKPQLIDVATSVLFFLSDTWGDDGMKVFWNTLVLSTWKGALENTFGQSVDDLEKGWKEYYGTSWPDRTASKFKDAQQKLSSWKTTQKPLDVISQNATVEMQKAEYSDRIWNFATAYSCATKAISILYSGFKSLSSEYIDLARAEIERARLERRTVGLDQAESDLQRCQQLYQQGYYEEAYTLASRALSTAKSAGAPMVAITSDTNTYVILLVAATVAVVVLVLWKRSRDS